MAHQQRTPEQKERMSMYFAEYYKLNRIRIRAQQRAWYYKDHEKNKESQRRRHTPNEWRRYKYGIAPEQFEKLRDAQNNMCAICDAALNVPHVDHNHDTGEIRGLLCRECNLLIGLAEDRCDRLQRAITYLAKAN